MSKHLTTQCKGCPDPVKNILKMKKGPKKNQEKILSDESDSNQSINLGNENLAAVKNDEKIKKSNTGKYFDSISNEDQWQNCCAKLFTVPEALSKLSKMNFGSYFSTLFVLHLKLQADLKYQISY